MIIINMVDELNYWHRCIDCVHSCNWTEILYRDFLCRNQSREILQADRDINRNIAVVLVGGLVKGDCKSAVCWSNYATEGEY